MNFETTSLFSVTAEDINHYSWQDIIEANPNKECWEYCRLLEDAASKLLEGNDVVGSRVYSFLAGVSSFYPDYDSVAAPYGPMWQKSNGTRSLSPDDLTEQDLDVLKKIVHKIKNPEFRARVADLLWIQRKDYKAAQIAISGLLEAAELLKSGDDWVPYIERLDRAAALSAKKGFEIQRSAVVASLESAMAEFESDLKSGLLCARLLGVLLNLESGDLDRYAALSERLAGDFSGATDWHASQQYWELAAKWHRRRKDDAAFQRCSISAAECNVSIAEAGINQDPPQMLSAAHWMARGLEALRQARADVDRIEEIKRRLLSIQKQSLGELKTIEFDPHSIPNYGPDRDECRNKVIAHLSGLTLEKVILRFVHIRKPTDPETLRQQVQTSSDGFIADKVFGSQRLDKDGKVIDWMPPVESGEDDVNQAALRKKLVHWASSFHWPLAVDWVLEPARWAIMQEHPLREVDLRFLVTNNPFIPIGHEGIYLRGIRAGFFGDWLVAMHLLIPQLEASLRHVFQQYGVITSTLESDGLQREKDINQLLCDKKAEEILGAGIVFDLRGILIERFGRNMRNELAHGLMPEVSFYSPESVYLWWLIIRLCWSGFRVSAREDRSEEGQNQY